jgi:Glyoxalase-like domain
MGDMALATYKDLCIDAVDAARLGRFWADALRLDLELLDDGDARLTGTTSQHTVWINTVPEPVTVKQRVHLDIRADSDEAVLKLGATLVDDESFRWTVMKDPEGGELCVFPVGPDGRPGLMEICVDTATVTSAREMARWWAGVLGAAAQDDEEQGFSYVEGIPGAPFEYLVFAPVPEPKTVKNRIHIDVTTADREALVDQGASLLRPADEEIAWNVMADPDGNEFCAFVR